MKKILIAKLNYIKPLEEVDKFRPEHLKFLEKYFNEEVFIVSGRQTSLEGGIIIAHNITKEEFSVILDKDPYAVNSLVKREIIEFGVGMTSESFASFLK